MLGMFDSLGTVFAALAAGMGAVAVWFFRLWQGSKDREAQARLEAEFAKEIINHERESRRVAEDAQKDADEQEEKSVEEVRKGRRDHFTRQ